jgi:PAS domain S-box-containing protein
MRESYDETGTNSVIIDYLKKQRHGASILEIAHDLNMNRNLIAKYLSILHMQGRLELRSYGNNKVYRLSNKIPFQSLSLLSEDLILGFDKSLTIKGFHGSGQNLLNIDDGKLIGLEINDLKEPLLFNPDMIDMIRSVLDGSRFPSPYMQKMRGASIQIKIIPCIFEDGRSGAAFICSKIRMTTDVSNDYSRLLSLHSSLLREMREFYVEFSIDWEIVNLNASFSQYCGKTIESLTGITGLPLVSTDDMDLIKKTLQKKPIEEHEKVHIQAVMEDGSIRWQEWTFYIQGDAEKSTGYHGYGWDITDRRHNESTIEMYQSGVEKLLHQKTEELREVTGKLRKEIDERRILEKELKQREELYRNLTESTSDIVWELDRDNNFVFVNERVRSLLGYDKDEIIETNIREYVVNDEFDQIREQFRHSRQEKVPFDAIRLQIVRKDRTYAWVEVAGIPLYKQNGTFHGYRGIGRDITTKILAELEQKQLLSILESTPDLIAMADIYGNFKYINKAGRTLLQIPDNADITSYNNRSFIAPESSEIATSARLAALQRGFWIGDTMLTSINGDKFPVSHVIMSLPVLPGQPNLLVTIARDIRERIQSEQELARAYSYNRTLIEVSPDPLVTIGPDGKITDVNEATEIATGYSRTYLIGTNFNSYFTEPERADEGYQQVFSQGVVRDYPLELLHKDGKTIPVLYNAVIYRDERDRVQGIFAAARDITEIRKYQDMITTSLSYYLNILDKFPNPIWRSGTDAKCDYFNRAWLEFTGRSMEEEIDNGWVTGVHPDDVDRCISEYTRAFNKKEPFCLMYRLHHHDRSYHWITDFGNPIFDQKDQFMGYIGSCYDIDKYLRESYQ